jgi:hypothetical protein
LVARRASGESYSKTSPSPSTRILSKSAIVCSLQCTGGGGGGGGGGTKGIMNEKHRDDKPMSNRQHSSSPLLSLFPEHTLYEVICVQSGDQRRGHTVDDREGSTRVLVDCRGRFIHDQHTSIPQKSSGNAQELFLSLTQVLSILSDLFLQSKRHPSHHSRHIDVL